MWEKTDGILNVSDAVEYVISISCALYSEVNWKSYCTHFLYCPAQLSWMCCTALYRPLRCGTHSLLCWYEKKLRVWTFNFSTVNFLTILGLTLITQEIQKTYDFAKVANIFSKLKRESYINAIKYTSLIFLTALFNCLKCLSVKLELNSSEFACSNKK